MICAHFDHEVKRIPENTPIRAMLEEFKKGNYHMAFVEGKVASAAGGEKEMQLKIIGLVTLEVCDFWNNSMK